MSEWNPEDGAGYIPTEEGGSGRETTTIPELIEQLEQEAQDVAENPRPRQTQAYANGVSAGILYAKDELEQVIE